MTTRASIILWSSGSGLLLGLFLDATLVGVWMILHSVAPSIAPRPVPKWFAALATGLLVALPLATSILGFLEGRLKAD